MTHPRSQEDRSTPCWPAACHLSSLLENTMQSAATKQKTAQLFPSQLIYVYPIYIKEGNPDKVERPVNSKLCH